MIQRTALLLTWRLHLSPLTKPRTCTALSRSASPVTEMPPHHSARQFQSGGHVAGTRKNQAVVLIYLHLNAPVAHVSLTAQPPVPGVRLTGPQLQCDQAVITRKAGSRAPPKTYQVRICVSAGSPCVHSRLGGPTLDS